MDILHLQAALANYFAPWTHARLIRVGKWLTFGEIDIRGAQDQRSVCPARTSCAPS